MKMILLSALVLSLNTYAQKLTSCDHEGLNREAKFTIKKQLIEMTKEMLEEDNQNSELKTLFSNVEIRTNIHKRTTLSFDLIGVNAKGNEFNSRIEEVEYHGRGGTLSALPLSFEKTLNDDGEKVCIVELVWSHRYMLVLRNPMTGENLVEKRPEDTHTIEFSL